MVPNPLGWKGCREGDPTRERDKYRKKINLTIFSDKTEDGELV